MAVVWKALTDYDGLGEFIPGVTGALPVETSLQREHQTAVSAEAVRCRSCVELLSSERHTRAGLAENRCLQRTNGGARLLQIGEQDVAMGFKFKARVVLDIGEHMHGVRPHLLSDEKVRIAEVAALLAPRHGLVIAPV